jgi:hypothetical protein
MMTGEKSSLKSSTHVKTLGHWKIIKFSLLIELNKNYMTNCILLIKNYMTYSILRRELGLAQDYILRTFANHMKPRPYDND